MKKFNKDSIDTLADVFCVWGGGYLETRPEIEAFLSSSHLDELISLNDYDRLLNHDAYLPDEALSAFYALLPVKLKLKAHEEAISPQIFNRLNMRTSLKDESSMLNIAFNRCGNIAQEYLPAKKQMWSEYQREIKKEAAKEKRREASKLRMRAYRAEHPEKAAEVNRKAWKKKTAEEKEAIRQASRIRNRKYRKEHRIDIHIRNIKRRETLKQENPELLKEKDRLANLNADRKEICKRYYEKHKEIITEKARNNPKTKEYKQRYKAKKRFQNTTNKIILPLLYGIINAKSKE